MLVVVTLSLKLRKTQRREERQWRFDTGKLKIPNTEKAFQDLKNRFHILQEEQELSIDSFNQALMETSKKLLGYRRKKRRNGSNQRRNGSNQTHGQQLMKEKQQKRS